MGLFGNLFGKKASPEAVGNDIDPQTGNFVNKDNDWRASEESKQNLEANRAAHEQASAASQQARLDELKTQGPVADSAAVAEAGSAAYAQTLEQAKAQPAEALAGAAFVVHDANLPTPETTPTSTAADVEINITSAAIEPILNNEPIPTEGAPIAPMTTPAVEAAPSAATIAAEVTQDVPDLTIKTGAELNQAEATAPADSTPNPTV